MERINEFGIEPGVYKENTSEWHVVVFEVITHHCTLHHESTFLNIEDNVLVVFKNIEPDIENNNYVHRRMTISLSDFKLKFIPA